MKVIRTKNEIARDVAFVLGAPLHRHTKSVVIDNALWCWSGIDGKYDGCKHWTKAAWSICGQRRELRHEHVVPKKVMINHLLEGKTWNAAGIKNYFEAFCIGVVVTREEDLKLNKMGLRSKMPSNWDGQDPWARYRAAGLIDQIVQPAVAEHITYLNLD